MIDILNVSVQELEDLLLDELLQTDKTAQIIVYNDDFNTFDWVIESLMEICGHTFEQAEQLSILVHYKGKAGVKTGGAQELAPLKDALVDRGLSAVIEMMAES